VKELKAVPAEAGQDDKEWCERGCDYHWRIGVDSGSVLIFTFEGSCGQAYLSEDEADMIANALHDCANVIRENRKQNWKPIMFHGFNLESHDLDGQPGRQS
jgi:hypothetical protein